MLSESLGATVNWDQDSQKVTITSGDDTIEFTIGDNNMFINGTKTPLDTAAVITNNRAMIPLRAVTEALDAKVVYENNKITIDK